MSQRLYPRALGWIARLVPRSQRNAWRHEWHAEMAYDLRRRNGGATGGWMLRRLIAAVQHAISLRWHAGVSGARLIGLAGVGGDVRYAMRGLRRSPAFSLTVITTLAVGLGLAAAIFSFADGYLFRPLPFPGGDRTYYVYDPQAPIGALLAADTVALRQGPTKRYGFVEWSVASNFSGQLVIDDRPTEAFAYEVSPGFRSTLALPLIAGRDFDPSDHLDGAPLVCWLSHRFWQREFAGDRGVVGRVLRTERRNGTTSELRVAGILGPEVASFDLNNPPPDLVLPHQGAEVVGPNRLSFPMILLPPGVTGEQATRDIAGALDSVRPASNGQPRTVRLTSLEKSQLAGGKPTARVLFAGALLVLILASLNLVHLLLSRSAGRALEVATRAALGASRWRVARLFLVESLVMGAAGIGAGLVFGRALSSLIAANVPEFPTAGRNLSLVPMVFDLRVAGFAVTLGLVVAIAGGLWPAWSALRGSLHTRPVAPGTVSSSVSHRLARGLLASELTVATIVLVGTVFMGLGIYRYLTQPLGFETKDRYWVGLLGKAGRLPPEDLAAALYAARSVPGVVAATLETASVSGANVEVSGGSADMKDVLAERVPGGHMNAWGMKLRDGRWFRDSEFEDPGDIAVVNTALAARAWPGANPIGAFVRVAGVTRQIVGVVDSRKTMLDRDAAARVYIPGRDADGRSPVVVWAPNADPSDMIARLAAAVERALPNARVTASAVEFDRIFARSVGEARFQAPVMAAFGILAVVVAAIGVFGLVSYLVERRRREFGIRLALGAGPADVWRAVVSESIRPTLIGLILGSAGAYALEAVVRSKVFGWQSSGPWSLAAVTIGLLLVAVAAALVPAARAARIDPVRTLRAE